jgi:hypothetical protein
VNMVVLQGCKDERDRIYALLVISLFHLKNSRLDKKADSSPEFGYTAAADMVYAKFARYILGKNDVDILQDAGSRQIEKPDEDLIMRECLYVAPTPSSDYLPSWAVDFGQSTIMLEPNPLWTSTNFSAGFRPFPVKLSAELPGKLTVQALILGSVKHQVFLRDTDPATNMDAVRNAINYASISSKLPSTTQFGLKCQQSLPKRLWRKDLGGVCNENPLVCP